MRYDIYLYNLFLKTHLTCMYQNVYSWNIFIEKMKFIFILREKIYFFILNTYTDTVIFFENFCTIDLIKTLFWQNIYKQDEWKTNGDILCCALIFKTGECHHDLDLVVPHTNVRFSSTGAYCMWSVPISTKVWLPSIVLVYSYNLVW